MAIRAVNTALILLIMSAILQMGCIGKQEFAPITPSDESVQDTGSGTDGQTTAESRNASGPRTKPISIPGAFPTEGGIPILIHLFDNGSIDSDGWIVKWEWNFCDQEGGEGGWHDYTASEGDAWHFYDHPGNIVAHLRVTDNEGNKDTAFVKIRLSVNGNANPVAIGNAFPDNGDAPLEVALSTTGSYDPDGDIVKYEWDFGDGVFIDFTSTCGETTYTYTTPGTYTAILRVTDEDGGMGTASIEIQAIQSQGPGFVHTWGGSSNDCAFDIEVDPSGNVYIVGETASYGAGNYDLLFLMYDTNGNLVYTRTWGGSSHDRAKRVDLDSNGNIMVAGWTMSYGAGGQDLLLINFSPDGDVLWQRTWGGAGFDESPSLICDQFGHAYVGVHCGSFGGGWAKIALLNYSLDGTLNWQKTWGESNDNSSTRLIFDEDGNLLSVGSLNTATAGGYDALFVKYSPNGSPVSKSRWGGYHNEGLADIALDGSGNIFVCGYTKSYGTGDSDFVVLKLNSEGNLLWQKTWGGPLEDIGLGMVLSPNGNLYVGGLTRNYGTGGGAIALLEYSQDGDLQWARIWDSTGDDCCYSMDVDSFGSLYIAGRAGNAQGAWQLVSGTENIPSGITGQLAGADGTPNGSEGTPSVSIDIPTGIEDTGAGGTDVLVMKIDPSSL